MRGDARQPAVSFNSESYQFLNCGPQSLLMSTVAQPKDPRREQLRQQAMLRRQRVMERISGVRMLIVGGVVAASCLLAGYMDAAAHTTSSATTGSTGADLGSAASGYGNYGSAGNYSNGGGSTNYGSNYGGGSSSEGGSGQSLFGGGSPPSSSSGSGGVVSGGS